MEYKILVGSKDEKVQASVLYRKQDAFTRALAETDGKSTAGEIAQAAQGMLEDDSLTCSANEVTRYFSELGKQRPKWRKALPAIKVGRKGKTSLAAATDEEGDDYFASVGAK